jgi:Uma2 family endonuclease
MRHELFDGRHVVTPPPDIGHQRACGTLHFQLGLHLRRRQRGEVLFSPIGLKLSEHTVVQPDALLILDRRARSLRGLVDQVPDLVIEVLSPSTKRNDRGRKKNLYELAGVAEYWIVDLRARVLEQHVLRDGRYELLGTHRRRVALERAPDVVVDLTEFL